MKKLMNTLNDDKADSALIIFLLSIPLLLIVMGFVTDLNKNVNAKIAFNTAAQESAQSSVRTVNAAGSLNSEAATAFVNEYNYQISPSGSHTNEIGAYKSETCNTVMVNGTEQKAPYIQIKLNAERGSNAKGSGASSETATSIGGGALSNLDRLNNTGDYKVISAEVYDTSTNNWAFFGLPNCQTHHSTVSAVTFGSNEDQY